MVVCHKCGQRRAVISSNKIVDGKQVYIALCEKCYKESQETSVSTSQLDKFGRDLTLLAQEGKLDPVIGRQTEVERVIHILSRRTKNNPVLIGEPGVGKTAVVEGLAQRIIGGQVPEILRHKKVFSLDMASILAGTAHRGQFEARLKDIIKEVAKAEGQIILFMDEVHTLIGAGAAEGAIDAANMLKPSLARGELQMIGATTLDEYRKHIEKDAALERRFQPVMVKEPTIEESIQILKGLRENYETHHQVRITNDAIEASVNMSKRYINDRFLPDKAIDLMDEASAQVRISSIKEPSNLKEVEQKILNLKEKLREEELTVTEKNKINKELVSLKDIRDELVELWTKTKIEETPNVTKKDVAKVVSLMTGIPLEELSLEEKEKLSKLEERLSQRVVGQAHALKALSAAIRRSRAGLKDPKRPIGTFLFLGSTGIGKTEVAKSLAEVLYGSEDMLVRLDMTEYMERHTVSRLFGAPPGYVGYDNGGQLTDIVRRKPFSIILLDEVEKAHSDVFNALLQIMDDGRLTDGKGRTVDFKNTIIIMTSNLGSNLIKKSDIGFNKESTETKESEIEVNQKKLDRVLKDYFRPEFLNRIDETVIFTNLTKEDISKIVEILLVRTKTLLKEQDINLELDSKAVSYLIENGYSSEYGARPLKRLIQREIENKLSELIIGNELESGQDVEVSIDNDKLAFKVKVRESVQVY
jgi:ATP-dependent Clp protease ATP-binding subunit ClpC